MDRFSDRALRATYAAAAVGVAYALISAYWAVGATALLDTIGGSLERTARAGGFAVEATLWIVVVLKLFAAWLPVAVANADQRPGRLWHPLAQLKAAILTIRGLVLTSVGLLAQAGVIDRSARADQKALAWHAFLWDPWFLIWGLLIIAALRRDCNARRRMSASTQSYLPTIGRRAEAKLPLRRRGGSAARASASIVGGSKAEVQARRRGVVHVPRRS